MEPTTHHGDLATDWAERRRVWARKLGRLRLGVEPLAEQLARYRRTTWALTIVSCLVGAMFLAIFAAFGKVLVGLVVVGIIFGPIVALAWLDMTLLEVRAARYERERALFEGRGGGGPTNPIGPQGPE
jgi:hypothetical protein